MNSIFRGALAAGIATIALTVAASAGDMSGLFGNTIECKYPDGQITKVWVEAGGKFTVQPPGAPQPSAGTWADDGSTVCYTDSNPAPNMKPVCSPSTARKVGDSWAVTDPMGKACTATLVAGHQ